MEFFSHYYNQIALDESKYDSRKEKMIKWQEYTNTKVGLIFGGTNRLILGLQRIMTGQYWDFYWAQLWDKTITGKNMARTVLKGLDCVLQQSCTVNYFVPQEVIIA